MKHGQIMGMPLILLFGLIVAAMILAFGIRYGLQLMDQGNYVAAVQAIGDIEANVQPFQNYDEGSGKTYPLEFPDAVETVCFYDPAMPQQCIADGGACSAELEDTLALVLDSQYNVYLFPEGVFDRTRFGIQAFSTDEGNPVCASNGNEILFTTHRDTVGIGYYA